MVDTVTNNDEEDGGRRASKRQRRRSTKYDDHDNEAASSSAPTPNKNNGHGGGGGGGEKAAHANGGRGEPEPRAAKKMRIKLRSVGNTRHDSDCDSDVKEEGEGEVNVKVAVDGEPCKEGVLRAASTKAITVAALKTEERSDHNESGDEADDEGEAVAAVRAAFAPANRAARSETTSCAPVPVESDIKAREESEGEEEQVDDIIEEASSGGDDAEEPAVSSSTTSSAAAAHDDAADSSAKTTTAAPPGRECRVPHCTKYKKSKSYGYCQEHYTRHGPDLEDDGITPKPLEEPKIAPAGRGCKLVGCTKYRKAKCEGYCLTCFREVNGGRSPIGCVGGGEMEEEDGEGEEGGSPPPLPVSMPGASSNHEQALGDDNEASSASAVGSKSCDSPIGAASATKKPPPPQDATATASGTPKSSKYCAAPDCFKYRQTNCYGYCLTHRLNANPALHATQKHMLHLTSSLKKKTCNKSNLCKWNDCEKYIQSNCQGYCLTHVKFANYEEGDCGDVTKVRVRVVGRLQNGFCQAVLPLGVREEWGFNGVVSGGLVGMEVEGDEMGHEAPRDENDEDAKMSAVKNEDELEEEEAAEDGMEVDEQNGNESDDDDAKPSAAAATAVKEEEDTSEEPSADNESTLEDPPQAAAPTPKKKSLSELLDFPISATPQKKSNGATKCKAVSCPKNSQGNSHGFCRAHHNRYLICTGQCSSWDCVCGEKIVSFQARCGKCHRWRGGKHNMSTGGSTRSDMMAGGDVVAAAAPTDDDGGALTYVPPDAPVQVSSTPLTNDKGRSICQVIGCGKMDQSNNDGFCRSHFNMFAIVRDGDGNGAGGGEDLGSWTCVCGTVIGGKQKRCGNCNKWRGGKRQPYTCTKNQGVSEENIIPFDDGGTWTCDCGNEVPSAKARCGNCHHWRGGRRTGGWKLGAGFASNYDSDDGIDRTQDWECCGKVISAMQTRCGSCNKWRGGKRVPASAAASSSGPPWECGKCGMANPGSKKRCGGCLVWKGSVSGGGGRSSGVKSSNRSSMGAPASEGNINWGCKKCNFENFATELLCFMCQQSRPNWQWHKKQQLIAAGAASSSNQQQGSSGNGGLGNVPSQQHRGGPTVSAAVAAAARSYHPVQAPTSSLMQSSNAAGGRTPADLAAAAIAAAAATSTTAGGGSLAVPIKDLSYYGTIHDGQSYPYISIHYDYNRAYYTNHDYSYLLTGVVSTNNSSGSSAKDNDNSKEKAKDNNSSGSSSPPSDEKKDGGSGNKNEEEKVAEEVKVAE